MSAPGKLARRLALPGIFAAWMLGDIFFFHGPAHRWLESTFPSKTENLVARVSGQPITKSQLDRAVCEALWLEGKSPANLTLEDRKAAYAAALDGLIEHKIIRARIKLEEKQPSVSQDEINESFQRVVGRFENKNALESAMKPQGITSESDLRNRLAAHIQQEKFIETKIAQKISVTDDEAKKWFDENQTSLANPERVEARHIFIPTLDHPPEEAKQKLEEALVALTEKKKDFGTLAREISEDPATKDSGGALGWMSYDRLPVDFAAPLFSLELNKPTLIRSRLGWHLAEVTAHQSAASRTFEQARPEILSALESVKRHQAVSDFRNSLRKSEAKNIEILRDVAAE